MTEQVQPVGVVMKKEAEQKFALTKNEENLSSSSNESSDIVKNGKS